MCTIFIQFILSISFHNPFLHHKRNITRTKQIMKSFRTYTSILFKFFRFRYLLLLNSKHMSPQRQHFLRETLYISATDISFGNWICRWKSKYLNMMRGSTAHPSFKGPSEGISAIHCEYITALKRLKRGWGAGCCEHRNQQSDRLNFRNCWTEALLHYEGRWNGTTKRNLGGLDGPLII
jgi:hypothetical protein